MRNPNYNRTKDQRMHDRVEIAEKMCEGMLLHQIVSWLNGARAYTLGRTMISREMKAIRQEWREARLAEIDEIKAADLAQLEHIQRRAWECYLRSTGELTKTEVVQSRAGGKGKRATTGRSRITKETRDGSTSHLSIVIDCIRERKSILGYAAPTRSEISGPDGGPVTAAVAAVPEPLDLATARAILTERILAEHNAIKPAPAP